MASIWAELEALLPHVAKPARYIGLEDGAIVPTWSEDQVAWLLTYPDTYEVGLPNQGLQILAEVLNERDDALAERAYAPWSDLDAALRREGLPLFSVESHRGAGDFDVLAFNLSAELGATNVLNLIDLAGVPIRQADRGDDDLFVVVGGHGAFNPEPLADFIDLAVLGDGEEVVGEISAVLASWKAGRRRGEGTARAAVLRRLARIAGVYVPSLYTVTYDEPADGWSTGGVVAIAPRYSDVPAVVEKRVVEDLAAWPYPKRPLAPLTEVVHDRLSVEVFRGCTRGCRFCQAGMVTRPVRERPAAQVRTMVEQGMQRTGHREVSLSSLSTADHSQIDQVVDDVLALPGGCGTTINLPSLRVDAFTVGLAGRLTSGRRSGLTFAPEAGTWRLRQVINKLVADEDLFGAVEAAFSQGWTRMKLYFLIGLPTETDEDVLAIAELARRCVEIGAEHTSRASVTVSVGGFVPKAHTPFQWFGQATHADVQRKVGLLRDATRRMRGVHVKWHDPAASTVEGLLSRGDRRIGAVVERVWRDGGVFQEWGEFFDLERWERALEAEGLSLDWFCARHRREDEVLPWSHLSAGLQHEFLWEDWEAALAESGREDCRWTPCDDCGVCTGADVEHVLAAPSTPGGGR